MSILVPLDSSHNFFVGLIAANANPTHMSSTKQADLQTDHDCADGRAVLKLTLTRPLLGACTKCHVGLPHDDDLEDVDVFVNAVVDDVAVVVVVV